MWISQNDEVARLYHSGATTFNPRRMVVVESDWIRCARRQTRKPNLFMYHHKGTNAFVVAIWAVKPNTGKGPGLMVEIETLVGHPDKYDDPVWYGENRPSMEYIRSRCGCVDNVLAEYDKQMAAIAYEEDMAQEETNMQRKDVAGWLERKGPRFKDTAEALRSGEMEYVGDREARGLGIMNRIFGG